MPAAEDFANCNPVNKAACERALTRLVSLLKGMKNAPTAGGDGPDDIKPKSAGLAVRITINAITGGKIHESYTATS